MKRSVTYFAIGFLLVSLGFQTLIFYERTRPRGAFPLVLITPEGSLERQPTTRPQSEQGAGVLEITADDVVRGIFQLVQTDSLTSNQRVRIALLLAAMKNLRERRESTERRRVELETDQIELFRTLMDHLTGAQISSIAAGATALR